VAVAFTDRVQGRLCQDVARDVGDFVLRRADGIYAYQLAVVVDDAFQGVNQVARGADLMLSTPRQIVLQRLIGLPTPAYAHFPVALDRQGRKLSKTDAATPVDPRHPLPSLLHAWAFLGQPHFPEPPCNIAEFQEHALLRWDIDLIPATLRRPADMPDVARRKQA
jgi:glutamyl-Q tRNA(Asp) synthetase